MTSTRAARFRLLGLALAVLIAGGWAGCCSVARSTRFSVPWRRPGRGARDLRRDARAAHPGAGVEEPAVGCRRTVRSRGGIAISWVASMLSAWWASRCPPLAETVADDRPAPGEGRGRHAPPGRRGGGRGPADAGAAVHDRQLRGRASARCRCATTSWAPPSASCRGTVGYAGARRLRRRSAPSSPRSLVLGIVLLVGCAGRRATDGRRRSAAGAPAASGVAVAAGAQRGGRHGIPVRPGARPGSSRTRVDGVHRRRRPRCRAGCASPPRAGRGRRCRSRSRRGPPARPPWPRRRRRRWPARCGRRPRSGAGRAARCCTKMLLKPLTTLASGGSACSSSEVVVDSSSSSGTTPSRCG